MPGRFQQNLRLLPPASVWLLGWIIIALVGGSLLMDLSGQSPRGPIYPGAMVGRRSADLSLAGGRTTRRGRGRARGTRSICRLCHHPTATVQPVCEPTHTSSKTAGPGRIRLRCPRCRARRSLPDDTHCVEFLQVHEIDLTCPGRNRRPSVTRARVNNCRCSFYVT